MRIVYPQCIATEVPYEYNDGHTVVHELSEGDIFKLNNGSGLMAITKIRELGTIEKDDPSDIIVTFMGDNGTVTSCNMSYIRTRFRFGEEFLKLV